MSAVVATRATRTRCAPRGRARQGPSSTAVEAIRSRSPVDAQPPCSAGSALQRRAAAGALAAQQLALGIHDQLAVVGIAGGSSEGASRLPRRRRSSSAIAKASANRIARPIIHSRRLRIVSRAPCSHSPLSSRFVDHPSGLQGPPRG